jgi:methionyl aminopeptidase
MTEAKLSRNAACWCGSGKKYKKCHLEADLAAAVERIAPLVPRARDILEIRDSILAPRQVRSEESGSSRR